MIEEARAQGRRHLTLVLAIVVAAVICALAAYLLSFASCRSSWLDNYARQEESAAAAACAYCEDELDAADASTASVATRGLSEWRELTFRPATRFEVAVETSAGKVPGNREPSC